MRLELVRIDRRVRGSVGVSVAIHAVLIFLLTLLPKPDPVEFPVIEVTWVETPILQAAAAAPQAVVEEKIEQIRPAPRESKVQFARQTDEGIAPRPQDLDATRDRLRDRLATLQKSAVNEPPRPASITGTSLASVTGFGGVPGGTSREGPVNLTRSGSSGGPPVELNRAARMPGPSAPALQKIQEQAPRKDEAGALAGGSATREVLSGIRISGPVADRPLLTYRPPAYPEWAQREMVEGSVRLHFNVLPDGTVKENIFVEKTSGFEDFDANAITALSQWKFAPLGRGVVGEQWGSIVFDYKLN
jgi:protein TonB